MINATANRRYHYIESAKADKAEIYRQLDEYCALDTPQPWSGPRSFSLAMHTSST